MTTVPEVGYCSVIYIGNYLYNVKVSTDMCGAAFVMEAEYKMLNHNVGPTIPHRLFLLGNFHCATLPLLWPLTMTAGR